MTSVWVRHIWWPSGLATEEASSVKCFVKRFVKCSNYEFLTLEASDFCVQTSYFALATQKAEVIWTPMLDIASLGMLVQVILSWVKERT